MEAAPSEGQVPSGGLRRYLAILVVAIILAAIAGVVIVVFATLNERVGVVYQSTLTQATGQALVAGRAERSPIIIEVNETAFTGLGPPNLCRLDIEKEIVHEGKCERFRYEYRYQESRTSEITFAVRVTIGLNRTQSVVRFAVSAEGGISVDQQESVSLLSESWRVLLPSVPPARSADTGTGNVALSWPFELAPTETATNNTTANGWVWVNITVSVTISFTITINTLVVVEGDCRGATTSHYHWAEAEAEFRVEVELEAHEEAANGTVTIVTR